MEENRELELARSFIEQTGVNLFLTGRAGTGKTTFLRTLQAHSPKRMIVVAPTGVAAMNAGGITLHSFFQLPFGPYIPEAQRGVDPSQRSKNFRFNRQKIAILQSIDLLVIDEISMVRADLLDAVSDVLRRYRDPRKPFGGVQLLLIGDLQQLAPVARDEEWSLLREYYTSPYFFDAQALKATSYVCIELHHIYRQRDPHFIEILNGVRDNTLTPALWGELNARYQPDFIPDEEEGYITLTSHNQTAQQINLRQMDRLSTPAFTFEARTEGSFPEYLYPTDAALTLKEGAQVMFIKNDLTFPRRYYNGKIGRITALDDEQVEVTPLDSDEPILLQPEEWTNAKYQIDPATGEISETIEGRFIQYPLKTAWAITIHKSQGLTFERAVIDAADSFSHGQVYVALSRCKTIDGIILRTPLSPHCMIADSTVAQFNDYAATHQPDERELARQRRDYYLSLLFDLFDFHAIERSLKLMRRTSETYFGALYPHLTAQWRNGCEQFTLAIETIAQRFIAQLQRLATQTADPATDPSFNERIAKGRDYFAAQCRQVIEPLLLSSDVALDNQVAQQELRKRLQSALRELHIKLSTLEAAQEGFTPQRHLQARALATLDPDMGHAKETAGRKTSRNTPSHKEVKIETSADLSHPALAERLRNWRQEEATTRSLPNYVILSQKALIGISNLLPSSAAELRQIKGVGAKFLEQYGTAVLQIVGAFRAEHGIDLSFEHLVETQAAPSPPQKSATKPTASHRDATTPKPKIDTRQITLDLLNEGFTPEEAAHQRGLSPSTLYGHIADLIRRGTVEVERFMPEAKIQRLTAYLREHPEERFARMQEDLGNDYTYAEICWVKAARSAATTASDSTAASKES